MKTVKKILLSACFLMVAFAQNSCQTAKNGQNTEGSKMLDFKAEPVRGVWLTNVITDALDSKEKLKSAVKLCADYGFNSIFVVVWNRGRTLYPSPTMQKLIGIELDEKVNGRDILQETLDAARPFGIHVYAWFEFGFSCDIEEKAGIVEGKEILERKPNWAARDVKGNIVKKNGFRWLNGFDPEVQDFMLSLLVEVVKKYPDLAGIQGDDRLPAMPSEAGYDPLSIKLFSAENGGQKPPSDSKNAAWLTWRANRMNDFMRRIHDELKALKPSIVISMAPSLFPWAKDEYLQDWPNWVKNGWVDMVCPQVYRYQFERYAEEIKTITTEQVSADKRHLIFPGVLLRVGDYYASTDFLSKMVATNRAADLKGEVFFYYEGLKKYPDFFKTLYKK